MPTEFRIPFAASAVLGEGFPFLGCKKIVLGTIAPRELTLVNCPNSGPKQPDAGSTGFARARDPIFRSNLLKSSNIKAPFY